MKKKSLIFVVICFIFQGLIAQTKMFPISSKQGVCFINEKGEVILSTKFDIVGDFQNGIANFIDTSGFSGYINTCGKILFSGVGYNYQFNEGLAPYYLNGELVFIDESGNVVIRPKYENYLFGCNFAIRGTPSFSENLAAVVIRKSDTSIWFNYIFIDKVGKKVFNMNFLYAGNFSEGLAFVELLDGECGFINKLGKLVIRLKKGDWGDEFKDNCALISDTSGNYRFINKLGKSINDQTYKDASSFSDGMAQVEVKGKLDYINTKGEMVIKPIYDYSSTYDFSEGLAPVSISKPGENSHYTFFIDKTGKICSRMFKNAIIQSFKHGLAYGTISTDKFECNYDFYINKMGEKVWSDTICNPGILNQKELYK